MYFMRINVFAFASRDIFTSPILHTISAKATKADDKSNKDDKKATDSKSEEISEGCIVEVS